MLRNLSNFAGFDLFNAVRTLKSCPPCFILFLGIALLSGTHVSWKFRGKMTYFECVSCCLSSNNGGLPGNHNNNDNARRNVSGQNAHMLQRINSRAFTNRLSCIPRIVTL